MTRALFGDYAGPLYSVMKKPENTTKDIFVVRAGGVADSASQDTFCGNSVCIVQRIYDQSSMQNHLGIEHGASNLGPPRNVQDSGVNFTDSRSKAMLSGKPVYSAFFAGSPTEDLHFKNAQGYSNRTARGTARGDDPQSMYVVLSGRYWNSGCCFDYGNAENASEGKAGPMFDGSMEAIYFGSGYAPQGPGSGSGPWIGADMENGIYEGGSRAATAPSLAHTDFVVGFVNGNAGNHWNVKAGDAQVAGSLKTIYEGVRPPGYEVMKKQGGIVLGVGGDNSPWGAGVFYEGVMTAGYASNETDNAVMANVVAAGYSQH
jgi:hypothetical protein